ncbi:3-oxoacid CoA-transferase subunit A, partial [Acinetobacter baumannii]
FVFNYAASGDRGLTYVIIAGCVKKMICSFPISAGSTVFLDLYIAGKIELELVPQGNLACRIQAAGAGLGAIFTPTGYGTKVAEGKETRTINGKNYVLEYPLDADFALI